MRFNTKTILYCIISVLFLYSGAVYGQTDFSVPIFDPCPRSLYFSESYEADLVRVVDADTFKAEIVVWPFEPRLTIEATFRLAYIDACEKYDKPCGPEATEFSREWLTKDKFFVRVKKKGKFGRYIAEVCRSGSCLNKELLKAGYAEEVDYE